MRSHADILAGADRNAILNVQEITSCIACGRDLRWPRKHHDTCSRACWERLLRAQRERKDRLEGIEP